MMNDRIGSTILSNTVQLLETVTMLKWRSLCVLLSCTVLVVTLAGCGNSQTNGGEAGVAADGNIESAAKASPIEVSWIALSAADYMLDFRYQVVDPERAKPLMDRSTKPYLIHYASGAKLIVPTPPKVGALRQKSPEPQTGKTYFIIFSNPGKLVKKGDTVAVVIGEFRTEDLVVQ